METLKACPLCGDKDEFNPSVSTSYKYVAPGTECRDLVESGHFIECDKCGCCGPIAPTEEAAIEKWNTRTPTEANVERVARAICDVAGHDPDYLEPGDDPYQERDGMPSPCIDGYNRKGEPCHFMWRKFDPHARAAISAATEPRISEERS